MKLSNNIITKLQLTEEDIANIKNAVAKDSGIIEFLTKYIAYRQADLKTTERDFDKVNWEFRRAFLDGRINELNWLQTLLTEGETNE